MVVARSSHTSRTRVRFPPAPRALELRFECCWSCRGPVPSASSGSRSVPLGVNGQSWGMAIEVRPATTFEDVRTMVGPKRPDASVCWCLSYRLLSSKENRELVGPARGERVLELVHQDPPPGVLAYDGDEVVGWAAVHPRADTSFAKNRKIPHVDDLDVWSVWCIRVRPGHRGRGHLPPPAGRRRRVRPRQRRAGHRGLPPRQRGGEDRPDDGLRRHEAPLRTGRVHEEPPTPPRS